MRWWTADRLVGRAPRPAAAEEPALRVAVLACMDGRLDPAALLGLRPGEAHVIRNAGGLATPETLKALRFSQAVLGTYEVAVIHHTGCAALAALGRRDVAASVRGELERLRAGSELPRRDAVRGFMLDLASGRLSEVVCVPPRRARPAARRARRA